MRETERMKGGRELWNKRERESERKEREMEQGRNRTQGEIDSSHEGSAKGRECVDYTAPE